MWLIQKSCLDNKFGGVSPDVAASIALELTRLSMADDGVVVEKDSPKAQEQ